MVYAIANLKRNRQKSDSVGSLLIPHMINKAVYHQRTRDIFPFFFFICKENFFFCKENPPETLPSTLGGLRTPVLRRGRQPEGTCFHF